MPGLKVRILLHHLHKYNIKHHKCFRLPYIISALISNQSHPPLVLRLTITPSDLPVIVAGLDDAGVSCPAYTLTAQRYCPASAGWAEKRRRENLPSAPFSMLPPPPLLMSSPQLTIPLGLMRATSTSTPPAGPRRNHCTRRAERFQRPTPDTRHVRLSGDPGCSATSPTGTVLTDRVSAAKNNKYYIDIAQQSLLPKYLPC